MTGQTLILSSDNARRLLCNLAWKAPHGAVVNIREATRTLDQNAKMQAMLSDVARQKPGGRVLTTDQWKCLMMDAVAKETRNATFTSRWEPSLDGEGVVNTGFRSSRLTKAEMADLITFIQKWGDENGIQWSDETREAA